MFLYDSCPTSISNQIRDYFLLWIYCWTSCCACVMRISQSPCKLEKTLKHRGQVFAQFHFPSHLSRSQLFLFAYKLEMISRNFVTEMFIIITSYAMPNISGQLQRIPQFSYKWRLSKITMAWKSRLPKSQRALEN